MKFKTVVKLITILCAVFFVYSLAPAQAPNCHHLFESNEFQGPLLSRVANKYYRDKEGVNYIHTVVDITKLPSHKPSPYNPESILALLKNVREFIGSTLRLPTHVTTYLGYNALGASADIATKSPKILSPLYFTTKNNDEIRTLSSEDLTQLEHDTNVARVHEYAHIILDLNLEQDSPIYRDFYQAQILRDKIKTIKRRLEYYSNVVQRRGGLNTKHNEARRKLNEQLDQAIESLTRTRQALKLKYGIDHQDYFLKAHQSIHELTADFITVLYSNKLDIFEQVLMSNVEAFKTALNRAYLDGFITQEKMQKEIVQETTKNQFRSFEPGNDSTVWLNMSTQYELIQHSIFGETRSFLGQYINKAKTIEQKRILLKVYYQAILKYTNDLSLLKVLMPDEKTEAIAFEKIQYANKKLIQLLQEEIIKSEVSNW